MATAWVMVLLIAAVHDSVSGVFSPPQNDQPRAEGLFQRWPDAKGFCHDTRKRTAYERQSKCHCNNDNNNLVIDCVSRSFDSIPSDIPLEVARLNFAGNSLSKLSFNSSLNALESLNVSNNRISEVDSGYIDTKWLPSLKSLDLSRNSLRSESAEFGGLKLSRLDLSHNQLESVTDSMFLRMDSLVSLNLSSCKIERVSYDGFCDLTSLGTLDLSCNKLQDVQHEWLRNLRGLQKLHLQGNSIQFLRNVAFSTLRNLRVLDLSRNSIKAVGLLSFKGLVKLQFLNLSSNAIPHLQEGVFRSLESVQVVDLSDNDVSSLDNIFTHAVDLERLHLRNSRKLTTLTQVSLHGAENLHLLDLSGSVSLAEIHLKTFRNSRDLAVLDLSGANLTRLKMGTLDGLGSIETLKLSGNPWTCDCHMYWLLVWLGENTRSHLLKPSETQCSTPDVLSGHTLLDALDHSMTCTHAVITNHTTRTQFKVGARAHLECSVDGSPAPQLTWITPSRETLHWDSTLTGTTDWNKTSDKHFHLTPYGGLEISDVQRGDGGFYMCVASNPLGRTSASIRLTLDYRYLVHIKVVSVLVGLATSFGFLLATLISVLVRMVLRQTGVRCGCRKGGSASPRTQQIKKVLESMEHYKRQQLDRLRGNYNMQVQRIKDNCMQQMERLRESYSSQAECLRDFREYGTLQIDRIRENYYSQVQRVRDYSASQIVRLRENYLCRRNQIRKFSAHHLYKLRENYKVQQQHLNKILENLNIESCRNVCQRTESVIFEPPEIALAGVFVPPICLPDSDSTSQVSAYFTPDEAGSEISDHERDLNEILEGQIKAVAEGPLKALAEGHMKAIAEGHMKAIAEGPMKANAEGHMKFKDNNVPRSRVKVRRECYKAASEISDNDLNDILEGQIEGRRKVKKDSDVFESQIEGRRKLKKDSDVFESQIKVVPRGRMKVRREGYENVEVHVGRRRARDTVLKIEDKATSTSDIRCVDDAASRDTTGVMISQETPQGVTRGASLEVLKSTPDVAVAIGTSLEVLDVSGNQGGKEGTSTGSDIVKSYSNETVV